MEIRAAGRSASEQRGLTLGRLNPLLLGMLIIRRLPLAGLLFRDIGQAHAFLTFPIALHQPLRGGR